jgi:hypothetical protein
MHLDPGILPVMHFHDMVVAGQFGEHRHQLLAVVEVTDTSIVQGDLPGGKTLPAWYRRRGSIAP